jgi:hypothetical protein
MIDDWLSAWLHYLGGRPCFRIYGKGRREARWRVVSVYATHRRDADSCWPLCRGTCITWTSEVIVVGWDFAEGVLREQAAAPASRTHPVAVAGGRLNDLLRRATAGVPDFASASEVLAHECGHTWQALRIGPAYLPLVGSVTLFQEGPNSWNRFENEASEEGLFGGLVNRSVCPELMSRLRRTRRARLPRGQPA